MKPHKSRILVTLLGLLLTASISVMGQTQTPNQGDQKKPESCCAMGANGEAKEGCCCCSGDSCDMMKDGKHDMKSHAADGSCCNMKHKEAKNKNKQKTK